MCCQGGVKYITCCLTVRLIKWYSHIWKVVSSRVMQVKSPMESNSKKLCILGHYEQGKCTRLFTEHIMKYFPHPQTVCTRPSPQGWRGLGTRLVQTVWTRLYFFSPNHKILGTRCYTHALGHSKLIFSFWSYPSFLHDAGGRAIKSIGLRNLHH